MFVRTLRAEEQSHLQAGLRCSEAFTMRRCQILLASSPGQRASEIAGNLGCATQTVRNAIHDFHAEGLQCLSKETSRPKSVPPLFDQSRCEALRELLHRSPRYFDKQSSIWNLESVTAVTYDMSKSSLHGSSVAKPYVMPLGVSLDVGCKRAKHWITSPDPDYAAKKRLQWLTDQNSNRPGWVIGYQDESCWSRLKPPTTAT